jgi:outer membrane protein
MSLQVPKIKKPIFLFLLMTGAAPAALAQGLPIPSPVPSWTLQEVEKIALEQNPDLKSAKANFEAVSKVVGQSFSGYLPRVDVSMAVENTTLPNPSALSSSLIGVSAPYSYMQASIKQTVFDFGKVLSRIEASQALSRSAEQNAIAVRNTVILASKRAFYNVLASDRLVEVAKKSELQFQETHRRAEVLVRTGTKPPFDLSQANVELECPK